MNEMKVSVIVPLYNYANYLTYCIDSFLDQHFLDSEMIIVNDGSTDNPDSVLKDYFNKFSNTEKVYFHPEERDFPKTTIFFKNSKIQISYITHYQNLNYSNAKNTAIRQASGKYIVPLDADDLLTTGSLKYRYERIVETDADLVHCPCFRLLVSAGQEYIDPMWDKWLATKDAKWIHAQGVIYRKDIHKKIGLYDTQLWASADREMFYRIQDAGLKIEDCVYPAAHYRVHDQQMSSSPKKKQEKAVLKQYIENMREIRKQGDYSGLDILA